MSELPGWAYALLIVLGLYVVLVGVLVVTGRGALAREAALLLPNLVRLFRGLLGDAAVPWHAKAALAIGIVWLASPIDLVPEFIPVAGPLDDAIVAGLVLAYVARVSGRDPIERHWRGDPRILRHFLALAGHPLGPATSAPGSTGYPREVAAGRNDAMAEKERVLFLCVRNSARSQMAEGILRSMAGDRYEVASAGVEAGALRPEAVAVMREIGIDISMQRSKSAETFAGQNFDLVVTTCEEAKEACPLFPGAGRMLHWSIPDPAAVDGDEARRMAAFRAARDELREWIERDLLAPAARSGTRP